MLTIWVSCSNVLATGWLIVLKSLVSSLFVGWLGVLFGVSKGVGVMSSLLLEVSDRCAVEKSYRRQKRGSGTSAHRVVGDVRQRVAKTRPASQSGELRGRARLNRPAQPMSPVKWVGYRQNGVGVAAKSCVIGSRGADVVAGVDFWCRLLVVFLNWLSVKVVGAQRVSLVGVQEVKAGARRCFLVAVSAGLSAVSVVAVIVILVKYFSISNAPL